MTWLEIPKDSHFSIHNLPWGRFRLGSGPSSIGVAIGDEVLNVTALEAKGYLQKQE